jgi:hypothetical protein
LQPICCGKSLWQPPPGWSRSGGKILHIVLCYPYLDLRFLIEGEPRPRWVGGDFGTVGSFGKVLRAGGDGLDAEIRANAALAFGKEYEDYRRHQAKLAAASEAGAGAASFRPRKTKDPLLDDRFTVCGRSLLANGDGHVRLELILSGDTRPQERLEDRLESIMTATVNVVREGPTEVISAGFPVARLYLEQSAKTAAPHAGALTVQLLREGEGSPFLVVLHPDPPPQDRPGTSLPDRPALFAEVTCRLVELAGRTTGLWEIWGCGEQSAWLPAVRMLCRIICQLSEVASLTQLQQDPGALAPHLLDPVLTERFFRLRSGQLRRSRQGDWTVPAVQSFAAQHLKVAIDETLHSRESLASFLRRDVASDVGGSMGRIIEGMTDHPMLKHADRERLVRLLAMQALNEEDYFPRLIKQAQLPPAFKLQKQRSWTGNPETDALDLVDWALSKGSNPAAPSEATLASILLPELGRLGLEDAATIVATVSSYRLTRSEAELSDLQVRYQCPVRIAAGPSAAPVGPDFPWHGPADDLELQSWLSTEPPGFLDVGYLIEAIDNARSVCLVEVGASGKTGTGVLVDARHVLTNHHVVEQVMNADGPLAEAGTIRLAFGSFSAASQCHHVGLDAAEPIVAWSPPGMLDFALLRLSDDIARVPNARPARLASAPPPPRAALSILQHPHGGGMKLAPSHNAVTFVDAASGLVQYVTRTASGSSGAPCFDEGWNLVAIHHAERARTFGSIREGILIGPIHAQIRQHLVA